MFRLFQPVIHDATQFAVNTSVNNVTRSENPSNHFLSYDSPYFWIMAVLAIAVGGAAISKGIVCCLDGINFYCDRREERNRAIELDRASRNRPSP